MAILPASPAAAPRGAPAPPRQESGSTDCHLGLLFWVQLGQIEIAGFRECTGFGAQTEVFEYAEGGLNTYTHKLPVRVKYNNITLKRGLDQGQDLYHWYMKAVNGQIKRQNISIIVYGPKGDEVRRWDLQKAY